jgi:hypothetical protein
VVFRNLANFEKVVGYHLQMFISSTVVSSYALYFLAKTMVSLKTSGNRDHEVLRKRPKLPSQTIVTNVNAVKYLIVTGPQSYNEFIVVGAIIFCTNQLNKDVSGLAAHETACRYSLFLYRQPQRKVLFKFKVIRFQGPDINDLKCLVWIGHVPLFSLSV